VILPILIDNAKQEVLNTNGYVSFDFIDDNCCKAILKWIDLKNLTDTNTYSSYKKRLFSLELYLENHNYLANQLSPFLPNFFMNYKIVFSRFLVKKCSNEAFIPAHQDRQFTDLNDERYPSYILWIPLVDVSLKNGTIGFLKGSHLTYKAPPPPFPDPRVKRFSDETIFEMFPYLEFNSFKAGQAVLFDVRTFHGSLPNFSKMERTAIRIDLCHEDAQLVTYYLKKESKGKLMTKFKVDDLFYTRFPNEKLLEIYDNDEPFPSEILSVENYFLVEKTITEYLQEHNKLLIQNGLILNKKIALIVKKKKYYSNLVYRIQTFFSRFNFSN